MSKNSTRNSALAYCLAMINSSKLNKVSKNSGAITADPLEHLMQKLSVPEAKTYIQELNLLIEQAYLGAKMHIIDSGWEFLMDSSKIKWTTGFYAQMWWHPEKKHIVFACSGTKFDRFALKGPIGKKIAGLVDCAKDLINDVRVYLHKPPYQFKYGMQKFINHAIECLRTDHKEKIDGAKLIFTGHSLGAMLSDMGALYLHTFKEKFDVSSITLENPGSRKSMEFLTHEFTSKRLLDKDFDISTIKHSFCVINNEANWVNTCGPQYGHVYKNTKTRIESPKMKIKILPSTILHTLNATIEHFTHHDKKHFNEIVSIIKAHSWPEGMFDKFAKDMVHTLIDDCSCVIKKSKSSICLAASSAVHYVEDTAKAVAHDIAEFVGEMFSEDNIELHGVHDDMFYGLMP